MKKIKDIAIIGGGTIAHIANHFAVAAPAYGSTARRLKTLCDEQFDTCNVKLYLTKMAGGACGETNEDIKDLTKTLIADKKTKVIFFNCALVDWEPSVLQDVIHTDYRSKFDKYAKRLETKDVYEIQMWLKPSEKIISSIRATRKDIFLVGFKTTCGATKQEMYEKGLNLCKTSSVNLVLVNDTKTRWNMIVTPEKAS